MPLNYTNRRGDTYYFHKGVTKKGNPKYYASRKSDGDLITDIPEGFEIYENPDAQVFLRRILPKIFTDEEIVIIDSGMNHYSGLSDFIIDVRKNTAVIYTPSQDLGFFKELFAKTGYRNDPKLEEKTRRYLNFSAMMRFVLVDVKKREFVVERMCFLGSIDDWIYLDSSKNLKSLVKQYVQHLGKESFFELI